MTAGLGYSPAGTQAPFYPQAKNVDEALLLQAFLGAKLLPANDHTRAGFLGYGLARKAFLDALAVGAVGDGKTWTPLSHEEWTAAEQSKIEAARAASERWKAQEFVELDAEEFSPSRLAKHLPPELAAYLERMSIPRRREREAAILKKVGWKDVGLIGLDPMMLAARAEYEAARYARMHPARDEDGNLINQEPDHRRGRDEKVWRKRLRRKQARALLYVEAAVGAVGGPDKPGRPLYVSDYAHGLHCEHEKRTQEILSDLWLVREDDPSVKISMVDVDRRARVAKAAERRLLIDMMLHRWEVLGWHACWITITLPGEYVPHSTNEGHRVAEWNPDLGPLEAMGAIQHDFHRVMCILRERRIRPQGWWNSQPQQSGTPHRHILVAVPTVEQARAVCDAFRKEFSTRTEGEDGSDRGCRAFVIGGTDKDYAPPKGRNGKKETAASVAKYAARYSTRYEPGEAAKEGRDAAPTSGNELERFEAWKRPRRARGHTWLGLDSRRSPIDLWRTLWANAQRSDYEPDDVRMALALRHMRAARDSIKEAVRARENAAEFAWGDDKEIRLIAAQVAADDAARHAWHAAIAVGMWPDKDLDPAELEWLRGETASEKDSLPPMPLRETRTSIYGEERKVIVGAVGAVERFKFSGRLSREELCETAKAVGIDIERPTAKLRRRHVLDSIEEAGILITWRERKLTLAQLLDHAERLGVTVQVPIVAPLAGETMKALKGAGFGFYLRPDGTVAGYDLSGEILMRNEHKWLIADTATAEKLEEEQEERGRAQLSVSPTDPSYGPDGPLHGVERPSG